MRREFSKMSRLTQTDVRGPIPPGEQATGASLRHPLGPPIFAGPSLLNGSKAAGASTVERLGPVKLAGPSGGGFLWPQLEGLFSWGRF